MTSARKPAPPNSLEELDQMLGSLRQDEADEQHTEETRRGVLLSGWNDVAPLIDNALGQVNAVLTKHGYNSIELAAPQFNNTDASTYGAEGHIPGINYGNLLIVLSDEMILHVNDNCGGHWSEGHKVPLKHATVEGIASSIADVAKWLIAEEPA